MRIAKQAVKQVRKAWMLLKPIIADKFRSSYILIVHTNRAENTSVNLV